MLDRDPGEYKKQENVNNKMYSKTTNQSYIIVVAFFFFNFTIFIQLSTFMIIFCRQKSIFQGSSMLQMFHFIL
jgi:hypothetical protein